MPHTTGHDVRTPRITLCRALLVLGIVAGIPSLWQTLTFSWDPTFQAPAFRYGPSHTQYHAFRGDFVCRMARGLCRQSRRSFSGHALGPPVDQG